MEKNLSLRSNGYSHDYIEDIFWVWYEHDKPAITRLHILIPDDGRGNRPNAQTIRKWCKDFGWSERASKYDTIARERVEKEYINRKTQMLSRHAASGRMLQDKGMEYLENNDIKSGHVAIRAVELGIEIERESTNLEKLIETVTKMDDPKIQSKLESLLSKASMKKQNGDQADE